MAREPNNENNSNRIFLKDEDIAKLFSSGQKLLPKSCSWKKSNKSVLPIHSFNSKPKISGCNPVNLFEHFSYCLIPKWSFLMCRTRPLFCLFSFFLQDKYSTNLTLIDITIDGVLGIQTWGRRIVGADKTTELWRPPFLTTFYYCITLNQSLDLVSPIVAYSNHCCCYVGHWTFGSPANQ